MHLPQPTGISRDGATELSKCYLVNARSKGELLNHRGSLFVMMKMSTGGVASHTLTTSTMLHWPIFSLGAAMNAVNAIDHIASRARFLSLKGRSHS